MKKRITKIFKIFLSILFLPIFAYLLLAILLSIIPTQTDELDCSKNKAIYLSPNGVHIDLFISKNDLPETLIEQFSLNENINYIGFGWGDEKFYTETPSNQDIKASNVFHALFLNSSSAVHTYFFYKKSDHWKEITVCDEQLTAVIKHIEATFQENKNGKIIHIEDSGYSKKDTFYAAKGSYSCFNTCNHWLNRGLKKANIKTGIWSPFSFGILYHLK